MKVLGISGSPRAEGNTETLVKKALEVCEGEGLETEYMSLAGKKIEYCLACDSCVKAKECVLKDDLGSILDSMREADAIIVGSPVYFGSVTGQLKTLFDRSRPLRLDSFALSKKIGGAIAVGASRNGGQEFTCNAIHNWMLIQEMGIVGDKGTAHFGGIGVGKTRASVLEDETGLKTVENLAYKICEKLKEKE